jgi:hypothetical protein
MTIATARMLDLHFAYMKHSASSGANLPAGSPTKHLYDGIEAIIGDLAVAPFVQIDETDAGRRPKSLQLGSFTSIPLFEFGRYDIALRHDACLRRFDNSGTISQSLSYGELAGPAIAGATGLSALILPPIRQNTIMGFRS